MKKRYLAIAYLMGGASVMLLASEPWEGRDVHSERMRVQLTDHREAVSNMGSQEHVVGQLKDEVKRLSHQVDELESRP